MQILVALLLLALMAVCCWGPGFLLVRRLRWSTQETICASIGLSLIVLYLASTAIYLSGVSWKSCWAMSAGCAAATLWTLDDTRRLLRLPLVRREIIGFAYLLMVSLLLLSITRHYSGGRWSADWLEHFRRMEFFLDRGGPDTKFVKLYLLPARPPMMNLLATFFAAQIGRGFDLFQIVFLVLNLLVYFPCVLLANLLVRRGGAQIWLIAAFLAASPVVMQNATWTWTKMLTACFVILSLALYLRGWKVNEPRRIIAAAAAMAAALLVHYSAGPYAVAIALHYPFLFLRRKQRWMEVLGSAAAGLALLCTWFAWSIAVYGSQVTFRSNTAVTDTQKYSTRENLLKCAENIMTTVVPHPIRLSQRELQVYFDQPNPFGFVRDVFFMLYQVNLPMTLGSVGWMATIWLMVRQLRGAARPVRWFWIAFVGIVAVLGIAVHGKPDDFGLAHICLLPLTLIGLTLLASGFPMLPRWARYVVAVAIVVDVVAGVLLHFRMQMHLIQFMPSAGLPIVPLSDGMLSPQAVANSISRVAGNIVYFADHCSRAGELLFLSAAALLGVAVWIIARAASQDGSRRAAPWFPAVALASYTCLAAVCSSDRWLGYALAEGPPWPANLTQAEVADRLAPLRDAAMAKPHDAETQFEFGKALYGAGQIDDGASKFLEAFLLDPESRAARNALNLALVSHGSQLTDTYGVVAEKVRVWPEEVDAQRNLAFVLAAHGHAEAALRRLERVMQERPDSAVARHGFAVLLAQFGDVPSAVEQCKQALALEPNSTEIAADLRKMMKANGDDAVSIEATIRELRANARNGGGF